MSTTAITTLLHEAELATVDMSSFSEEDRRRANEIAASINVKDSQTALQYGIAAQSNISRFADSVLEQVRAKDAGHVGQILTDLMLKAKSLDVASLSNKSGLQTIPFIGKFFSSVERFLAQYEKLDTEIDRIIEELDKARMQLLKDVVMLDKLYETNLTYFRELNVFIAAGQVKLNELRAATIPELQEKARTTGDMLTAQEVNDLIQFTDRFEKKLHDLKLSRTISLQTAPQVRLIQNSSQLLVEKIQTSILSTIPLWKNQIVIALALFRQNKAVELQREVSETTNQLLLKNSEMLKTNTLEVAKESERGIVEIQTLQQVHANLLNTIDEVLQIQQDGKVKRQKAEEEIAKIEQELKNKLISLTGRA